MYCSGERLGVGSGCFDALRKLDRMCQVPVEYLLCHWNGFFASKLERFVDVDTDGAISARLFARPASVARGRGAAWLNLASQFDWTCLWCNPAQIGDSTYSGPYLFS